LPVLYSLSKDNAMKFDVEAVLESLGLDADAHGEELCALCPMHERRTGRLDHLPSWWINAETGAHICFSCGYKGNIFQLVCDVKEFYKEVTWGDNNEYDYHAAKVWLSSVAEVPAEKLQEMIRSLPQRIEPAPKPIPMSDARLAVFTTPPLEALDSRNITPETAEEFGILWDKKTSSWILPLRDPETNQLLGWQEKGTVERTFYNRPVGLKKSTTLFGVQRLNGKTAIVVESPLDCARLSSAGFEIPVAICGSSLSDYQVKLLRSVDVIIAAFDNDSAGQKANKEMLTWGKKYGFDLFFFNYSQSNKKDPGEMTDEEITWALENAKSSIYGESAYVHWDSKTVSN
jgi:5S rRNA maturation endonuclease (ribonuclease M5)